MSNPIQEYNKARLAPIPLLIQVLNGQSDFISDLGVAHAALKQKLAIEVAKKGANAMQMAQAPKVVNRDMQMAQGVASGPADLNVPMGGIVGDEGQMTQTAAGGGSVVAFQAGGTPPPTFGGMMSNQAVRARALAPGFMGYLRQGIGALDRFATGRGGLLGPQLALTPTAANVGEQEYLDLIKKLASLGYTADVIQAMTPEQRVAAAAQGPLQTGPTDTGGVPTQSLAQLEEAQKQKQEEAAAAAESAAGAGGPGGGPAGVAGIAAAQARVQQPIGQTYEQMRQVARDITGQIVSDAEPNKKASEVMEDYNKTLKAAGFDFTLMSKQMGELAKEKEELKKDRTEAANLRLIEAGLGILGGESPYAFVNIGKGASPALQGLSKDLKEIKAQSRALDKETMQLQLMQNQMAEGRGKFTFDALEKQKAEIRRIQERKAQTEASIFNTLVSKDTSLQVAQMSRDTSLQVANIQASKPSATVDLINQFPGKTFTEKYAAMQQSQRGQKILEAMAKEYMQMTSTAKKRFKEQNPELATQLESAMSGALPGLGMVTAPPAGATVR